MVEGGRGSGTNATLSHPRGRSSEPSPDQAAGTAIIHAHRRAGGVPPSAGRCREGAFEAGRVNRSVARSSFFLSKS